MNTRDLLFLARVFHDNIDGQTETAPPPGFSAAADRLAKAGWIHHDGFGRYGVRPDMDGLSDLIALLEKGPGK